MSDSETDKKSAQLEPELREMKIEEEGPQEGEGADTIRVKVEDWQVQSATPNGNESPAKVKSRSTSHSPVKLQSPSHSPSEKSEHEELIGGDITLKMEPGKAPKLSRTASQKVVAKPLQLFLDAPDATAEATATFQVITDCIYSAKYMGSTEHALECDCAEEWDPATKTNHACGEDSDCINRATKMECVGDCGCGVACQNQRFQQKQYPSVTVIKTEKKGYGLRADCDLRPHDFIFEYIGEVIGESSFRKRMHQYDDEGIKHFYFMSLSKGEFVDATKKGNLGRFCNHSCNPNCYVDKWVVGEKLRMGIFAERNIKAGEELVFNYNVDRYGADPQPCYCGEPNCSGYIGGKTQTERATKLSNTTIEALGIDDGDGWDLAVAKKPRKKKAGEDDEEYVNNVQPKSLEEGGVTKVMATLMQCKEKWIAVKLLSRIQRSDDEKVGHRVIRMHGYTILKTTLSAWMDDFNVVLQVLDILDKLPRITRNKIQDSKIEEAIEKLTSCGDERVEMKAAELLKAWSKLEIGYRIPRVKRDPNASTPVARVDRFDRREKCRDRSKSRSRSRSRSVDAPRGPSAPAGPRGAMPQRNPSFFNGPRPPYRPRPPFNALPPGWFSATAENGATYYYSANGGTQWQRPTLPAPQPPPPPPKEKTNQQKLQDIILSITQNATPRNETSASATPQPTEEPRKDKKERWRSLSEEKKMKLYENALFPHVKSVTDHYRKKLEKDDLKRLAKEVAKKLVRGDFKAGRVQDPTAKISSKHEKSVKKFVKEFMDKAVTKKQARDKEKVARAERRKERATTSGTASVADNSVDVDIQENTAVSGDEMMGISDDEDEQADQVSLAELSTPDLKRKREEGTPSQVGDVQGSPKKSRTHTPPPPPPPPPPPIEDMPTDMDESGYTPVDDVSDLFHSEAIDAVNSQASHNGTSTSSEIVANRVKQSEEVVKNGSSETWALNGQASPMQLATPPTTTNGSCEHESNGQDGEHDFDGVNPERHRKRGPGDGS